MLLLGALKRSLNWLKTGSNGFWAQLIFAGKGLRLWRQDV